MFSHVMIGADDIDQSKKFYDALLATLGHSGGRVDPKGRCFYRSSTGIFALSKPLNGAAACGANGGTIGFQAASQEEVDAWHAAGLANGGKTVEDPPGMREGAAGKMYLAYLLDPAGNKVCALFRPPKDS